MHNLIAADKALARRLRANLRMPVIVSPGSRPCDPRRVLAACKAGLVGSFSLEGSANKAALTASLQEIHRGLTDQAVLKKKEIRPTWAFHLDTCASDVDSAFQLALLSQFKPDIVLTPTAVPTAISDSVRDYGGVIFAQAASLEQAKSALDGGADGLTLVCVDAPIPHAKLSAFSFVSAVRRFFKGPIIVDVGTADARAVRAIEALGADFACIRQPFSDTARAPYTDDPANRATEIVTLAADQLYRDYRTLLRESESANHNWMIRLTS